MAATAAAAVASSFSTSMHGLKCISSKSWPSDHLLIRISCPKTLVSHSLGIESIPSSGVCGKWRAPRITAAVAQEETAVTAPSEAVEEEAAEEKEEVVAGDGAAAVENSGSNTKLYFGNLPYLCDSAQLAGIIQAYASPELVEV